MLIDIPEKYDSKILTQSPWKVLCKMLPHYLISVDEDSYHIASYEDQHNCNKKHRNLQIWKWESTIEKIVMSYL